MRYPCPCCGYVVFDAPPGTEDLCPVCKWRDDLMHLRFPLYNGLPNGMSLVDAQLNFSLTGFRAAYERDPDWRPIDLDNDEPQNIPVDFDGLTEPDDTTTLYYWRPQAWQPAR
jgi:hypothetical protein